MSSHSYQSLYNIKEPPATLMTKNRPSMCQLPLFYQTKSEHFNTRLFPVKLQFQVKVSNLTLRLFKLNSSLSVLFLHLLVAVLVALSDKSPASFLWWLYLSRTICLSVCQSFLCCLSVDTADWSFCAVLSVWLAG